MRTGSARVWNAPWRAAAALARNGPERRGARRAAPFLPADQRAQARAHRGSRLKAHPRRAAAAAHSSLPSSSAPPLLSPPPLRLRSSSSRIILIHSESLRRSVRGCCRRLRARCGRRARYGSIGFLGLQGEIGVAQHLEHRPLDSRRAHRASAPRRCRVRRARPCRCGGARPPARWPPGAQAVLLGWIAHRLWYQLQCRTDFPACSVPARYAGDSATAGHGNTAPAVAVAAPVARARSRPMTVLQSAMVPSEGPVAGLRQRYPVNLDDFGALVGGCCTAVSPVARNRCSRSVNTPGELDTVPRLCQSRALTPASSAQLAPRGSERRLARLELAGRQLPQPAVGHVAVLAQQAHAQLPHPGPRGRAAGVMYHFQQCAVPVGQHHLIGGHPDDASGEVQGLLVGFHAGIFMAVGHRRRADAGPTPRRSWYSALVSGAGIAPRLHLALNGSTPPQRKAVTYGEPLPPTRATRPGRC